MLERGILQVIAGVILVTLLHTGAAATVTKCVHDSTELQTYLTAAESSGNPDDYILQLRDGRYLVPSGGFTFYQNSNHSMDIEGGFFDPNGGNGCVLRILSANGTQLDGRGNQPILTINTYTTSGNITLRYLTFQHAGGAAGALRVVMPGNSGALRVENSLFTGNVTADTTVDIDVEVGTTYFIDNAVVGNASAAQSSQGAVLLATGVSQNVRVYANNNTIAGHTSTDNYGVGFVLRLSGSAGFDLANNIVWNSDFCDVAAESNSNSPLPAVTFDKNDIDSYCYATPQSGAGDISKDPMFVDPANGNYRLLPSSPAVEAGDNSPPGGTRTIDVDGQPRVSGTVDMGAYEVSNFIFADGFGP